MRLSRRVLQSVSAIALATLTLSAGAAHGAKPRFGAAPAPEEGPLLAPPAVEIPGAAATSQPAPFREESVPTWPQAQYGAPAQPRGRAIQPTPQTAEDFNEIPMIENPRGQAQPQSALELQRPRNPMPGRTMYPPHAGQNAPPPSKAHEPVAVEAPAVRKAPWRNPFAKREKAPSTAPQAESKGRFRSFKLPNASPESEEAPLYQYEPQSESQARPAPQPQRGWRWPWSAK